MEGVEMNQKSYLYYQIYPQQNIQIDLNQFEVSKILDSQEKLLRSLIQRSSESTISLRYFYNPDQSHKTKTYLLIKQSGETEKAEINALLTKGQFSKFFKLHSKSELTEFDGLNTWVKCIGQIIKREQIIEEQKYYLPHFFEPNQTNDMADVYDVINKLDGKLILEITLQTCHNYNNQSSWVKAVNHIVNQLDQVSSSSSSRDNLLFLTSDIYHKYQEFYTNGNPLKYTIKVLSENHGDAYIVLHTLLEHSTKNNQGKQGKILILNQEQQGFLDSLKTTENIDICTAIEWEGWQQYQNLWQTPIKDAIQPKKASSVWDKYISQDNMSIDKIFSSHTTNFAQNQLPPGENNPLLGTSALAKVAVKDDESRMIDLKPLHRLVTTEEISGFFRIAIPKIDPSEIKYPKATAEELFNLYKHLITEDTYIVGIDDQGQPVTSSWDQVAHRLIAGVPGAGKSNFINWVIYQFLYANPKGKIYIADFGGADFNFLVKKLQANVDIVTTLEECQKLVERIDEEHTNRLNLMNNYDVQNIKQLQEEGVDIQRTLWIIDEAADITHASYDLRETIEKRLKEYARKGRKFGINIIYCTQRPTGETITSQVTDQCGEKIVFKVSLDASQLILDNDSSAAKILDKNRGRAVLKGFAGKMFVNTPFIQVPVGSKVQVSDTIWSNIVNRP
jgi:FtsK/SpoIIIE family